MIAFVALLIKASVFLIVLKSFRNGDVHMCSMWACTGADVVANLRRILPGLLVWLIHSPISDLIIGIAIGLYVIKEAVEIWRDAGSTATAES